jgi:CheY-like chemotaxis protein
MGPAPLSPVIPTRLEGVRVLVVEDDLDAREMLSELLGLFGAECQTASDVGAARTTLMSAWTPDVVVSDIGLPDEDGYALSRWIHARPSSSRPPPVIAFTSTDDREATAAAGFVAHVLKPLHSSGLIDTIVTVVAAERAHA